MPGVKQLIADATAILTRSENPYYREGHHFLGTKTLPQITNQQAFFVYGENLRMNRLGQILSAQQGTVWGTGTHTTTPVPLVTYGPHAERFRGILHERAVPRAAHTQPHGLAATGEIWSQARQREHAAGVRGRYAVGVEWSPLTTTTSGRRATSDGMFRSTSSITATLPAKFPSSPAVSVPLTCR